MVRKNSIRLPSDRDVGTYLFGLRNLENSGSQLGWQKMPFSLPDPVLPIASVNFEAKRNFCAAQLKHGC